MILNYLMWVSGTRKISDFVDEALRLGISKKLPFLSRKLNKGSKIYLASLQIEHYRNIENKLRHKTTPVIFSEFIVDHVEFIVEDINPLLDEKFKSKGLSFCWITKNQARKEPKRSEGKRLTAGAMYAVDYPPDSKDVKIKERTGALTVYDPYVEIKGVKFFRGVKEFDLIDYLSWLKKQKAEEKKAESDIESSLNIDSDVTEK